MDLGTQIKLSKQVMQISGVFFLVVAVLLIANFWQLSKNDPLESNTMEALVERLASEPDNEDLKEEIRQFDLLARKAYFTATWQVKTGAFLLLVSAIIFAAALKIYTDIQKKITLPAAGEEHPIKERLISHRWLLGSGAVFLILAFIAAFYSSDQLSGYIPSQMTDVTANNPEDEIEMIRIVDTTVQENKEPETIAEAPALEETANDLQAKAQTAVEKPAEKKEITFYGVEGFKNNQATFRGLFGHGISYHRNIPSDWDGASGKNVKWKVTLTKPGYNSPVIWGDRLFIAGGDEKSRMVSCFDRNTGKVLWEREVNDIPGSPSVPPKVTDDTGLSAPTMAVDGNQVYAIFATGDLIAFDLDGNRIWARNLGAPVNHYGHSSSLIVWMDKLVIQYDTGKGGRMLTVNILNGETIWDISRDNNISWSSPILLQKNEKMQIITTADPYVAGYDLQTGGELWKVHALMGEVAPSAAYLDGMVFATNEYARTVAVRPEAGSEIIWEDNYYLSEVSSPVAFNGLLFLATSYGDLVCHDAGTGEIVWEHHFNHGFYSSPMIAENHLYIIDMGGVMHIVAADRSGAIINEPELGEAAYAIPAFAEGRIYIRSNTAIYCIEEE